MLVLTLLRDVCTSRGRAQRVLRLSLPFSCDDTHYCVFQPVCHQEGFLEGTALGRGWPCRPEGMLWPSDVYVWLRHETPPGFGGPPHLGVLLASTAPPGRGLHVQGQACPSPAPLVSDPAGDEVPLEPCVEGALGYLKRGYPLQVPFLHGEYTEGDSYLRIKL